jgi:hypothetical protein
MSNQSCEPKVGWDCAATTSLAVSARKNDDVDGRLHVFQDNIA